MRTRFLVLIAGVVGVNSGLVLDVAANGDDSKLYSLSTGKINENSFSINLDNKFFLANSFVNTFPFGGGPYYFVETGYLLKDSDVFDHATVDFTISVEQKEDGTFIDRVTECVFKTDVDINTQCVTCILRDANGINIAKGEQFFEAPYQADTALPLIMTEFLFDDPNIIDVRNVKSLEIGICKTDDGEESN